MTVLSARVVFFVYFILKDVLFSDGDLDCASIVKDGPAAAPASLQGLRSVLRLGEVAGRPPPVSQGESAQQMGN